MRIGIDAREMCGRATGVGRYLAGLLHEWATGGRACAHEFVLYASEPLALTLDSRKVRTRVVAGSGGTWWEQITLPRGVNADALDVWFAPGYTAPLRLAVPIVVAIHDLSFVAHPEWFGVREGARRRWLVRRAANAAAAIITISQFSKREIVERLNVGEARVHVVPPGIGARGWGLGASRRDIGARDSGLGASRRDHAAPGSELEVSHQEARGAARPTPPAPSPYSVLYVGSIFNRRHVIDLIRGFAPIARAGSNVFLDIVGDNRSHPYQDLHAAIAAEGLGDRIRWHEYVTDAQLHELYAHARAFAFLSEYEGLGLTPLEALAAGVPPVLLDTPVARESCGSAAVYVPMNDRPAITRALEALLFDEQARATLLDAAPAELSKYNWTDAALNTLSVIEGAGRP
ncbi:MAG TPA: glycosyltransferase family 1 protein [Vicinamibacterales bacterium]|nr:glycosyltransferase family 1 protein [Vicinamibacterales bacterium]